MFGRPVKKRNTVLGLLKKRQMTSENLSVSGFLETIKPGVVTQQLFKGCCASLFLFLMCQNMKQYQLDDRTKCSYPNLNKHIRKRKKIMS